MQVLYKELLSFAHLESYISKNPLEVIFANVAISWAIHDQKLDDAMDISNKTTTNITGKEFCAGVDLGEYFLDNYRPFTQQMVLESLKTNLSSYVKVYHSLSEESSRERYFALLLFFLCPYRGQIFSGLLGETPPFGTFDQDALEDIISNQLEIGVQKPELALSLIYRHNHVVDLPLMLGEINGDQDFSLDIFQSNEKYQVIFTAKPKGGEILPSLEEKVFATEEEVFATEEEVFATEEEVFATEE
ncbi:MAG: hypothetical protein R3Y63_15190, partial [Eubacteriales bacterium]